MREVLHGVDREHEQHIRNHASRLGYRPKKKKKKKKQKKTQKTTNNRKAPANDKDEKMTTSQNHENTKPE